MLRLENDGKHDLHTQDGVLTMSDLAATPFGGEAFTSLGVPVPRSAPALYDLVMGIKRQTQIMYPKDMGLICFKLGVGPGRTILEAGSGSGGFTLALSWFAGPSGRVHTFEAREEFHKLARRNLAWAGLGDNVSLHLRDIADGFGLDDPRFSAAAGPTPLFLDVRTPWDYLDQAAAAWSPARPWPFCCPRWSRFPACCWPWSAAPLRKPRCVKFWSGRKPVPDRRGPPTGMSAHTGFLVFSRHQERSAAWDEHLVLGTRERKQQGRPAWPRLNGPDEAEAADDE